jgi:hypothetical protein
MAGARRKPVSARIFVTTLVFIAACRSTAAASGLRGEYGFVVLEDFFEGGDIEPRPLEGRRQQLCDLSLVR